MNPIDEEIRRHEASIRWLQIITIINYQQYHLLDSRDYPNASITLNSITEYKNQ